jgi:hypothetical protein
VAGPASLESEQKTQLRIIFEVSFGSSERRVVAFSLGFGGCPATSNAAMETRSKRRKTEPIVDKVRRGEISVVVALAEELPDLFEAEVLPEARYLGHPQLGAGEQVVQPRGVERWWRSVDGGEDEGTLC